MVWKKEIELTLTDLIDVKGWKAIGNKFPVQNVTKIEAEQPFIPLVEIEIKKPEADSTDLIEKLKNDIKDEVEDEDNQLGLFGAGE